jgi:hypothetical protein
VIIDAQDLVLVGRSDRTPIVNNGMVFVQSGAALIQAPFTGELQLLPFESAVASKTCAEAALGAVLRRQVKAG